MNETFTLTDQDDIDKFELSLLKIHNKNLDLENEKALLLKEKEDIFYSYISAGMGRTITSADEFQEIPRSIFLRALDLAYGDPENLIQPSHDHLKYSLIKKRQQIRRDICVSGNSTLDHLLRESAFRNSEVMTEYTSENTKRAFNGDIVYWQAWLAAVGFSFQEPISEELVKLFIIQHVEGMSPEVDKLMVDNRYKCKLGTHSLETVKRRIVHLSMCLDLDKHPNPCRNKEVRILIGKLSKKYASVKKKRAVTKDVLDDFLETCKETKLDIRDRAILLFGWASGGRRRSEIVEANIESLTETPEGDYLYRLGRTKTDQQGIGCDVPIKGRAAKALRDWFKCFDATSGAIFRSISKSGEVSSSRLSGIDVNRIVKKRAKLAGYEERNFGAHSLRSGFVTEGGRRGKPLGDIMAMTTHKNVSTVIGYYQSGAVINNSASNLAD